MENSSREKIEAEAAKPLKGALDNIENLYDLGGDYLDTRIDLLRLKGVQKVSELVSSTASTLFVAIFVLSVIMMLNMGIGFWLGDVLGKVYYGFFALAGAYLIIGLIVYVFRDSIVKNPVADAVIKKIL